MVVVIVSLGLMAFSPRPGDCFWVDANLPWAVEHAVFKVIEVDQGRQYRGYLFLRPQFDEEGRTMGELWDGYLVVQRDTGSKLYHLGWVDESAGFHDDGRNYGVQFSDPSGLTIVLEGIDVGMCIPGLEGAISQ